MQTTKMAQNLAQLEADLKEDIEKRVRKAETRARKLVPIGTPVEYTVPTSQEEIDAGAELVKTIESTVDGDAKIVEAFGYYDVFVPIDGGLWMARTVKFLTDDSEQGLFTEDEDD